MGLSVTVRILAITSCAMTGVAGVSMTITASSPMITPVLGYLPVNGVGAPVKKVRCLTDGKEYEFTQEGTKLTILDVAHGHVDKIAGVTVFEITCGEPFGKFQRAVPPALAATLREEV